jgi:NAD(P)H-flavin reductase
LYSNRDRESTAFLDELQELERRNSNIKLVLTMTEDDGWDGESRQIDADVLRDHLDGDLESFRYLVAGPPPMATAVVEKLKGAGIPEEQVAADSFSGY